MSCGESSNNELLDLAKKCGKTHQLCLSSMKNAKFFRFSQGLKWHLILDNGLRREMFCIVIQTGIGTSKDFFFSFN
jgi:hypothetical protein